MRIFKSCAKCGVEMDMTWQALVVGKQRYHPECWQRMSVAEQVRAEAAEETT